MSLADIIIVVVIAAIVGIAVWSVHKSKKSGKKCIGCPNGYSCAATSCAGCCENAHHKDRKD